MGLIREDVLAAAYRGRELIAAGLVALDGLWLMWLGGYPGLPTQGKAVPSRPEGIAGTGGSGNASRFPARTETTHQQDRSPKRNEGQRPPMAGRALAGGFGPRRACCTCTAWPGRWPRPDRARRAQAERFPAFGSADPYGRHFFSALPVFPA